MDLSGLPEIAARHQVRLRLQHGSTVSGHVHANSDLDIAVLFENGHESLSAVAALSTDLQSLYPEREIDLTVINHADPLFLKVVSDH